MTSLHKVNGLAAPPTDAPVVADAHHHLWDLSALRYPWLQDRIVPDFMLGDYSPLRRDYLPLDYLADAKGCRVIATVHCEAEADRADPVAETRWLADQHRRFGFPNALVVHADFAASDCRDTLHRHLETSPLVRGVRCKPQLPSAPGGDWRSLPGGMADKRWLSGLAALEPLGLSWDLRVPWRHLEAAASVAGRFPGITMVVNHTGLPWDRSAAGLARWRSGLVELRHAWRRIRGLRRSQQPHQSSPGVRAHWCRWDQYRGSLLLGKSLRKPGTPPSSLTPERMSWLSLPTA